MEEAADRELAKNIVDGKRDDHTDGGNRSQASYHAQSFSLARIVATRRRQAWETPYRLLVSTNYSTTKEYLPIIPLTKIGQTHSPSIQDPAFTF